MKKLFKKIRTLSKTKWRDLSTMGRVGKVLLRLAEVGLIIVLGAGLIGFLLITIIPIIMVTSACSGMAEGFTIGMRQNFNNSYNNKYW